MARCEPPVPVKRQRRPDVARCGSSARQTVHKKKGFRCLDRNPLFFLVGRTRFELVTNGLKVS